jgi:glycosyltransferase involved in cell wall biosynthesis
MPSRKRIVLVTNEILGLVRTGGAGTATTFLSFALAHLGHDVEILFTDTSITGEIDAEWAKRYAERDIAVRRLETSDERVEPRSFTIPHAVQQALAEDTPDVVIANDWAGPAYAALRSRNLGLDFQQTTFVVYCHGPNQWLYDARHKLGRSLGSFELQALERSSIELADVVVSPSAHLIRWMRGLGWALHRAVVVPYFTRSAVEGPSVTKVDPATKLTRLAFFGRLDEAKGVEPYIDALNELPVDLLAEIELLFVGKETQLWPAERVRNELDQPLKTAIAGLRFETELDQPEAIALLRRPGTLAVMPSMADNSPNVVYECLEHGIPFLASDAGGGPELVVPEDRPRTFVEPTAGAIRAGLLRMLGAAELTPARPSFAKEDLFAAWQEVLATPPPSQGHVDEATVVATQDFVLVHEDGDELDPDCLETLLRAQAASGADVVTCGVRGQLGAREVARLFLGEPRELGLVANHYGLIGLYRRSALDEAGHIDTGGDDDWLRLASLSLAGARIVSVPRPLARTERSPGSAATDPVESSAALTVAKTFEQASPQELRTLPRLVAGLAAAEEGTRIRASLVERARWIQEHEGTAGLARRVREAVPRALGGTRLRTRWLSAGAFLRRLHRPGAERQPPVLRGPGSEDGGPDHGNGRHEGNAELARIPGRPGTLTERVVRERDEPERREPRSRQGEWNEQEQEVVHPDDR